MIGVDEGREQDLLLVGFEDSEGLEEFVEALPGDELLGLVVAEGHGGE